VVEVECFSSEDTVPLGGRDTSGCIPVESREEFGAGDVLVVGLEAFAGLPAAVILGERGGVVRVIPPHVALSGLSPLPRWLVEVVDVILEVISRSDLVDDLVKDLVDGLVHRLSLVLFLTVHEESGVSSRVDRVEFLDVKVNGLFLFKIGEGSIVVDEHTNPRDSSGLGQFLVSILGDERRELISQCPMFILSRRLILLRSVGSLSAGSLSGWVGWSVRWRSGEARRSRRVSWFRSISHNMRKPIDKI